MSSPLLNSSSVFIKGEKKLVAIKLWDESNPSRDLSACVSTLTVYDQVGAITLASGSATITGTILLSISRQWDTTSVAPGPYRAVFSVVDGTNLQVFQYPIVVVPLPAP